MKKIALSTLSQFSFQSPSPTSSSKQQNNLLRTYRGGGQWMAARCVYTKSNRRRTRWMKKYSKVCYSFAPTTTMSIVILFCFMGEEWKARQGFLAKDSSLRPVRPSVLLRRPAAASSFDGSEHWMVYGPTQCGWKRWDEMRRIKMLSIHSFKSIKRESGGNSTKRVICPLVTI